LFEKFAMQSTLLRKALAPPLLFCSVRGIYVQLPRTLVWDGWWLALPVRPALTDHQKAGQ
jgi:hypothetical protein